MNHDPSLTSVTGLDLTFIQTASAVILGLGAAVIILIQPVLLAPLMHAGRLTAGQLGRAATSELIGTAVMTCVAGACFKPTRLRRIAILAVFLSIGANLLTMISAGNGIVVTRLLSGCCSGVLLWLLINTMIRSAAPVRLNGLFVAILSLLGFCMATLCSQWLTPRFGASGAFGSLLVFNVLMIPAALFIPSKFVPLPQPRVRGGLPEIRALVSLVSVGAYFGAISSLWVYFVPLSVELGLPKSIINLAVDLTIACQIFGGLIAAVIGRRLNYVIAVGACTIVSLLVIMLLSIGVGAVPYLMAVAAFGLVWMMAPPYQLLFVIAAGPSRRAATFFFTAEMTGAGIGPFLSSLAVSTQRLGGAILVSGSLFSLSLILLIAVYLSTLRNPISKVHDLHSGGELL